VVNDASYTAPVVPGSIAAVFGDFFLTAGSSDTDLPLVTTLQTLSFQFGDTKRLPLYFVSGGQVNLQVPWELAGQSPALPSPPR
jgi:minor extracellular serine protease Vpr